MQFLNPPTEVLAELSEALSDCEILKRGDDLDFVMLFTKSRSELTKEFSRMAKLLAPAGMLWVSWPKKSSAVVSHVDEQAVRDIGLIAGLVM